MSDNSRKSHTRLKSEVELALIKNIHLLDKDKIA